MNRLPRKLNRKAFALLLVGALTVGMLLGAAAPGSAEDPLVTQSWVNSYTTKKVAALTARVDSLSAELGIAPNEICMWLGRTTVTVNGESRTIDAAPMIENGRLLLPLRFVGEALDAELKWDNTAKQATYIKGETTICLWMGRTEITVNGSAEHVDVAPTVVNGRMLVPLRVVSETMGADVSWDNTAKKATVRY